MDKTQTEKLRGYAHEVLKATQQELTHCGGVKPAFWVPIDGTLQRLDLGPFGALLDSVTGKARLFRAIRGLAKEKHFPYVVWVSEAWVGVSTEKGLAMGTDYIAQRADREGMHVMVSEGLLARSECIMITVQCPEGTYLMRQPFERNDKNKSIRFGQTETVGEPEDGITVEMARRMKVYPEGN